MSSNRFFLNQPAGSRVEVSAVIDPPGSLSAVAELAINRVPQGAQPLGPGITEYPCPKAKSTYGIRIDLVWLAAGKIAVAVWLFRPDGAIIARPSVVLEGAAEAVDRVNILVSTT